MDANRHTQNRSEDGNADLPEKNKHAQNKGGNAGSMEKIKFIQIADGDVKALKSVHSLMGYVYSQLENIDIFVCDNYEFVERHTAAEGRIIAAVENGKIIGSIIVRFPKDAKDNLGIDINLKKSELQKVAHMESVVVHPEYRGNGIQRELVSRAEKIAKKEGYRYFMATVSPENSVSCANFEKSGYKCKIEKIKYGGKLRKIYLKLCKESED